MAENGNMKCRVNGSEQTLPSGMSLIDFLGTKNVKPAAVVIEHNGEVLPKGGYDGIVLRDGDMLEIVQIIGGG